MVGIHQREGWGVGRLLVARAHDARGCGLNGCSCEGLGMGGKTKHTKLSELKMA